jgi:hypothetical protein
MSVDQTWTIIERGKARLYDKATQRSEAIPIDEPAADLATMIKGLRANADGRPIWTMQVVDTRNMEDLYHRAFHESGPFAVATTMVIRWMSEFNAKPEQNPQCMVCKMRFGRSDGLNAGRGLPVAVYAAVNPEETTAHLHGVCEKCFAQVVGDPLDYLEPYYRALWPGWGFEDVNPRTEE